MSPATPSSHEIDKSNDNIYSASILIINLSSPSDYHVLESAIRNATRSTKDRLTVILHSPAFANQEDPQTNWFEIQRLLTWTYVESTAVAQDMDKVLLDTDVLLRPPHVQATEGTSEDEELVKEADAVYVFEDGTPRFLPELLSYRPKTSDQTRTHFHGGLQSPPTPFTSPNPQPGTRRISPSRPMRIRSNPPYPSSHWEEHSTTSTRDIRSC